MSVAFLFTNPKHHLEMMRPVSEVLMRRGIEARLVSLAEVRGFDTPRGQALARVVPVNIRKLVSTLRGPRKNSGGASLGAPPTTKVSFARRAAQRTVLALLVPLVRIAVRSATVVVVPNDAVFPYREIIKSLRRPDRRFVLMQEGIRFPFPLDGGLRQYGAGGCEAVCAWGEGSGDYFISNGAPPERVRVTGSPRADTWDTREAVVRSREVFADLGIASPPIVIATNPIELQGYGTTSTKIALVGRWLSANASQLRRTRIPVVLRPHPHENVPAYQTMLRDCEVSEIVTIAPRAPILPLLAGARAAIVMASTVGLEASLLGIPLAQLIPPGYDPPFEYVASGAALPLREPFDPADLDRLMEKDAARQAAALRLLERHFFDRGHAAEHVADVVSELLLAASLS